MKNSLLLAAVFLSGLLSAESPLPVVPARPGAALDFDFRGVGGKTEFKDRTGNYKLISDTAPMLEEEGALRVSDLSLIHI